MKKFLILFFLLLAINGYSQSDSTIIKYGGIENEYLSLISSLENIQLITISSTDTSLYGKRFFLYIHEYNDGKLINEDDFDLSCVEKKVPFVVGKDTFEYVINTCDHITFSKHHNTFKIIFAGKMINDSLKLYIKYPNIIFKKKLKGDKSYSLRPFQVNKNRTANITLNKKVPILLYTPPYKISKGINYYCILNNKPITSIFKEYKIRHFYVFLLAIK